MIRVATIKDASRLAEIQIFSKRKAFRPIFQNDDVSFNEMSVLRLALYYQDVIGALDDIYVFDDGIVKGMMKLDCKNSIWELKELYVDPFFQGEGVGTKLTPAGRSWKTASSSPIRRAASREVCWS